MSFDLDDRPVVHIIDDDESLCRALQRLFRSVDLEARPYGAAHEFIAAKEYDRPGCIVLDVRLPGVGGLELQAQLADLGVGLPIVMVTGHGDVPMTVRAMKAGAVDFLPKPFRDQDMLDAVASAIERDRRRRSLEDQAAMLAKRFDALSSREREVMMLATAGMMNKQIAGQLGLSEVTVKIHRRAAMQKMDAHTLADLVRMADKLQPRHV